MWSWGDLSLGYMLLKATSMMVVQITRILLVHVHEVRCDRTVILLNVASNERRGLLGRGFAWYEGDILELDPLHHSTTDTPFSHGHVVAHVWNLRT